MKNLIRALVVLSAVAAAAQQQPSKTIVLKAARLFDGTSDTVVANAVVVIEGNRIASVGSNAAVPANAQVIDLGDATLLPGFIDAHVHLTGESGPNWFLDFYQRVMRHRRSRRSTPRCMRGELSMQDSRRCATGGDNYIEWGCAMRSTPASRPGPGCSSRHYADRRDGGPRGRRSLSAELVKQRGPIEGVCNGPAECREAVRSRSSTAPTSSSACPREECSRSQDPVDAPELPRKR